MKIKAITLWQPWASLMAHSKKKIETRSWPTKYRGPLAIHSSKRPMGIHIFPMYDFSDIPDYPLGVVVGVCDLVDCVSTNAKLVESRSIKIPDQEFHLGNYLPDRYMWITDNMKIFEDPIPARGRQGLWEWEFPGARK